MGSVGGGFGGGGVGCRRDGCYEGLEGSARVGCEECRDLVTAAVAARERAGAIVSLKLVVGEEGLELEAVGETEEKGGSAEINSPMLECVGLDGVSDHQRERQRVCDEIWFYGQSRMF